MYNIIIYVEENENDSTKFDLTCNECDCICQSRIGLKNHQRCQTQREIVHYSLCSIYVTTAKTPNMAIFAEENVRL